MNGIRLFGFRSVRGVEKNIVQGSPSKLMDTDRWRYYSETKTENSRLDEILLEKKKKQLIECNVKNRFENCSPETLVRVVADTQATARGQ